MIKYSMLWVINSDINLPCQLPVNEKWKLREGEGVEKVTREGALGYMGAMWVFRRLEITSTSILH